MLDAVLRRDRTLVASALVGVTALAWAYLLWLHATMAMGSGVEASGMSMLDMDMPGMDMGGMMAPEFRPWSGAEFAFTFGMWAVMMVGMMTPSAAPMILSYAAVGRTAGAKVQPPFAATGWFMAGYLMVWFAFSLAATAAQFALTRAALLDPMIARSDRMLGGIILIAVGLYQWTPLKDVCLIQCQSPLTFIQRHGGFRRSPADAVLLGIRHGAYCLGCCGILMALLFVGGVMNVLWIAGLSAFVLIEKTLPAGRLFGRGAGLAFIAAGIWLAFV